MRIFRLFKKSSAREEVPVPVRGSGILDSSIQVRGNTEMDRYPEVFSKVSGLLKHHEKVLNILSFGCSSGEEVFTLANKYFPDPSKRRITGLEVDPQRLALARKNNPDPETINFDTGSNETLSRYGPYDIIFAMSVLCSWPDSHGKDDISPYFSFSLFEELVTQLDSHLLSGGYFVIANASFRFTDTEISKRYSSMAIQNDESSCFVTKFDRNNRTLGADYRYGKIIFQKNMNG